MIMLDGDHGQGFINSIGRDMINTNLAYFEKNKHANKVSVRAHARRVKLHTLTPLDISCLSLISLLSLY